MGVRAFYNSMRYRTLASLLVLACSGCIWQPDSSVVEYPYSVGYDVHIISQRNLDGSEHLITYVVPSRYGSSDLQYILVNGDTVYRHLDNRQPITIDSSAPFHLDGTQNIVTLVFPNVSVPDTSYEPQLKGTITAPAVGDTVFRSKDTEIDYTASFDPMFIEDNAQLQITDSVHFITPTDTWGNAYDLTSSEMQNFQPGTLWVELSLSEYLSANSYYYLYESDRTIYYERIVAYPLQ